MPLQLDLRVLMTTTHSVPASRAAFRFRFPDVRNRIVLKCISKASASIALSSSRLLITDVVPSSPVPARRIFLASLLHWLAIAFGFNVNFGIRSFHGGGVFAIDRSVLSFVLLSIKLIGLDWFYRSCCRRIFR